MLLILLFCSLLSCIFGIEVKHGYPLVDTRQGTIKGFVNKTQNSFEYYTFLGVPYAKPPLGPLRFRPPQPPEPFDGVRVVQNGSDSCTQIYYNGEGLTGQEDCLYLDIYVPARGSKPKSIMFWVHGGSFTVGTRIKDPSRPDYLIEEDVIFVTINYRLNALGFLSTQDDASPGNYGLKDQTAALRWVKENAAAFDGNPEDITIFGQSAGGASIVYLIQSPLAAGLFAKAIAQSGTTLNQLGYQKNPRTNAFKLGEYLGIQTNDSELLVRELRKVDARTLLNATYRAAEPKYHIFGETFIPCVEHNHAGAFLSKPSYQVLRDGEVNKVKTIVGHASVDGSFGMLFIENLHLDDINDFQEKHELLVPYAMNLRQGTNESEQVAGNIVEYFFKDGNVANKDEFLTYIQEERYTRGIRKTVEFLRKVTDVHFYIITFEGMTHGGELRYLFPKNEDVATWNSEQRLFSKRLLKMWANFAKTGDPTPRTDFSLNIRWPLVNTQNSDKLVYLEIGNRLQVELHPKQNITFWEDLFARFGNPPYKIY